MAYKKSPQKNREDFKNWYYSGGKEKKKEYIKIWRIKNRDKTNGYFLKWYNMNYKKNKFRFIAPAKVSYAIKCGIIKKEPCKICNQDKKVEGHHPDYSKPLEVIWLCKQHHEDLHHKKFTTTMSLN